MRVRLRRLAAVALMAAAACASAAPAGAQDPAPYGANDAGGFRDVLPPGTRGLYSADELGGFLTSGRTVPHCCDQLGLYRNLLPATPGLEAAQVPDLFKDATFGVRAGDVESTISPRADVTIVRDRGFGVPHVYGTSRDGALFGVGYAGAQDRLLLMDVMRHAGRAELSSFLGGANAGIDAEQWAHAPYTTADLERQAEQLPALLGRKGELLLRDVDNYLAGVNAYIAEARLDPAKLPGEYPLLGRPQGPDPFVRADVIATAALVGGIFGTGGGRELEWSEVADALERRFGRRRGARVFRDFRAAEDPEAPVTVRGERFPYQTTGGRIRRGSVARPDAGSLRRLDVARGGGGEGGGIGIGGPRAASNALLVSARESASGRPLLVAGPQVSYLNPQLLIEQDVHAPATPGLPGLDARGAAFTGLNLYVQLGHGRDYAWSATSAGQDIVDTFAVDLCEPDGSAPRRASMHYRFRGRCLPIEVLAKTNRWTPNLADATPRGEQRLRAERTRMGLVAGRGTVRGRPVAFTKLRSTYFHEIDSAAGFMDFNDPATVRDAQSFMRAASQVGYAFNWFYADAEDIAYYNSGANPVRARRIDHDFPVRARKANEWRGWDAETWTSRLTGFAQHPQALDPPYLVNWNNKPARGYRASDTNVYSSAYRSDLLEDPLRRALAGGGTVDREELIDIMALAGTSDLRAHAALGLALRVIGRPRDRALRAAVADLRAWRAAGGRREDSDGDGRYEHANAVRIMDAWWPRWVRAQFQPVLGRRALGRLLDTVSVDDPPNGGGAHRGSAYQGSWYGYVRKDLRSVLGRKVRGRYARGYCGGGSRPRCRSALRRSLRAAARVPAERLYRGDPSCEAGDQRCWDSIVFRPVGGTTQPPIDWVNRPTYQQVVEVARRLPR